MKSIVLEDEGWIYTGVKSSSNIFLYIMYSITVPEDKKKSNVFQVFSEKVLYIVFLEEDGVRGAEFWSFFPSLFSTFI